MSRHWALTLNNYTDAEYKQIIDVYSKVAKCLTIGEEIGEEGTPHLQVALSMKSITRFDAITKKLGPKCRWHVEPMAPHSWPVKLHSYCMKGESPKWSGCKKDTIWRHEIPGKNWKGKFFGIFPVGQGKDEQFKEICDDIRTGQITSQEIRKDDPKLHWQYGRTFDQLEDDFLQTKFRTWMTKGIWYTGCSGTGKSHTAFQDYHPDKCYVWKDDNGWQDGYKGQEIIIMNDFRGSTMKLNELFQMVDKWPHHIRRRGKAPMPNLAKTVIITCVLEPKVCYKNALSELENWEQFERRFKIVKLPSVADQILMDSLNLRRC